MPTTTTADVVVFATIAAGVGAAAIVDLGTRRVPNALTFSLAAAGIALAATGFGRVGMAASLAGCVLGAALMLPGHVLGGTGAGDVKLLAAAGTLMGPAVTFRAFIMTCIAGGVMAVWVAIQRGRLMKTCGATATLVATAGGNVSAIESPRSNNRFAYAPAIAVGVMLAALGW